MDFSFALGKRSRFWNAHTEGLDDRVLLSWADKTLTGSCIDCGMRLIMHAIETMSIEEMLTSSESFLQDLGKLLVEKNVLKRGNGE